MVERGPTLDRALRVFSHLLSALDYAHTRQPSIVHRDLKPSNVLMSHGDWPLLTDFGIAKIVEPSMQLTRTGMMVGTPEYMAPEQSEGRGVDHRADVYAMGIILFEILTGHVPFQGQTPIAVILQHVQSKIPSPCEVKSRALPGLDEVIARSLAKAPADRYPSAGAMSEAIQAAWRVAQSESGAARLVGQADPELLYESAERALSSGEWLRVVSICGQLLEIDRPPRRAAATDTGAPSAAPRARGATNSDRRPGGVSGWSSRQRLGGTWRLDRLPHGRRPPASSLLEPQKICTLMQAPTSTQSAGMRPRTNLPRLAPSRRNIATWRRSAAISLSSSGARRNWPPGTPKR